MTTPNTTMISELIAQIEQSMLTFSTAAEAGSTEVTAEGSNRATDLTAIDDPSAIAAQAFPLPLRPIRALNEHLSSIAGARTPPSTNIVVLKEILAYLTALLHSPAQHAKADNACFETYDATGCIKAIAEPDIWMWLWYEMETDSYANGSLFACMKGNRSAQRACGGLVEQMAGVLMEELKRSLGTVVENRELKELLRELKKLKREARRV